MAGALKRVWREAVATGRVGADAFAALIPCDERTGRLISERARAAIEGLRLDHNGQRVRATATVTGVSLDTLRPDADHDAFLAAGQKLQIACRRQGDNNTYW